MTYQTFRLREQVSYLLALLVMCSMPGGSDHLLDDCQQRQYSTCSTTGLGSAAGSAGWQDLSAAVQLLLDLQALCTSMMPRATFAEASLAQGCQV